MDSSLNKEKIELWTSEIKKYNFMHKELDVIEKLPPSLKYNLEVFSTYLLSSASVEEPIIREIILNVLEDNSYLVELENCIKGRKRLREKIFKRISEGNQDIYEISRHVHDVIRYTVIIESGKYINMVDKYLHTLELYDITVHRVKNKWNDIYCKGISAQLTSPTGFNFEIQFHTRDSYYIKEMKTRELYELVRNNEAPLVLIRKANILRSFYQQQVLIPLGTSEYEFVSCIKKKEKN